MLLPLFSAASDQVYLLYSIVLFHSLHLSGLCVAQLGSILCDPMDCSPPGSSVHGLFQARILEWVAISFSRDLADPGIESGSPAL